MTYTEQSEQLDRRLVVLFHEVANIPSDSELYNADLLDNDFSKLLSNPNLSEAQQEQFRAMDAIARETNRQLYINLTAQTIRWFLSSVPAVLTQANISADTLEDIFQKLSEAGDQLAAKACYQGVEPGFVKTFDSIIRLRLSEGEKEKQELIDHIKRLYAERIKAHQQMVDLQDIANGMGLTIQECN